MDKPIQRAGTWWQRHEGGWYRWSDESSRWERQTGGPPAPAPPGGRPQAQPHPARPAARTAAVTRPTSPANDDRFSDTWSTVKVRPAPVKAEELPDWYPDLNKPEPKKKASPLMIRLVVFAVLASLSATGYFGLRGPNGPAGEELDAAFTPIPGYEYQEVPADVMDMARNAIDQVPELSDVISDIDARSLMQGGRPVGAVLIYGVPPEMLEGTDAVDFTVSFQGGPGMSFEKVTRDGTHMYELTAPGGAEATFIDEQDGLVISVATQDIQSVRNISAQLAAANL